MSSCSIEPIKTSDYEEWLVLWHDYLKFYKSNLPESQDQNTFQRLTTQSLANSDPSKLYGLLVRDKAGKAQGLAHFLYHGNPWTDKTHCYLSDLFVNPECRGSGFGKALILKTKEISKEAGSARLYVRPTSNISTKWYRANLLG